MRTKLFLTGLALLAVTAFASAQDQVTGAAAGKGRGPCNGTGKGSAYVDANKDGICDNIGTRSAGTSGKKGKGNGKCNGQGPGQGQGKNCPAGKGTGI